ncbi:metallophosphoesterase family protein [Maricaulis parjimensis]|uniref:metallophosphoesterase family protein n=1 Tax=Maricaulis parjimensis TaxID=144023 RepID=UPI00193A779E|nr:metallophosphoesterase [Maricaulis parjimensis]
MTRILHIADLHFGAEHPSLVAAFKDTARTLKPDLIVAAGDFTQSGRKREFEQAADFFAALNVPAIGMPGNHDTPVRALHERFTRPWQRFESRLRPHLQPRHDSEQVRIETLLTARRAQWRPDWSLGRVALPALKQALDRLNPAGEMAALRVLTCHHPLLAPGGARGRARTARAAQAARLAAQSCDLVLTGHLHETFAEPCTIDQRTCWFVGAGTTFSLRTRDEPAAFNCLDVTPGMIRMVPWEARSLAEGFQPAKARDLPLGG